MILHKIPMTCANDRSSEVPWDAHPYGPSWFLLAHDAGERITALAEAFQTHRPKIERILNRALELGALASLQGQGI
jgi:hypothetical protein